MPELPTPSLSEVQPVQAAQEVVTPREQGAQSAPRHTKRMIFIAGAAIVGASAIGGLAYASWAGYLPNPFGERPSAQNFIASLEALNSAETATSIHLVLEAKENDVNPLDFSLFQSKQSNETSSRFSPLIFAEMLPSDLDINLTVDTSFSKTNTSANEETHIIGTYTGNNISANLDVTTRTVNDVTYIKPDAIPLPIPLFDMNALKGIWINTSDKNDNRAVFEDASEDLEETALEKEDAHTLSEVFAIIKQGMNDGAIIFSVPERVTVNNERVWKVNAVIDGEKLRESVLAVGNARETLFPETTDFTLVNDDFLTATKKERAKDIYRELFSRTNVSALLNDDSSPVSLSFSTRIAPKLEDDLFKDRQITLETTVNFSHLNETVTVEAPENAHSLQEAAALLMGKSADSVILDAQRSTITDLRTALDAYNSANNAYPETLNELLGTASFTGETVVNIPNDAFTEKPYTYTKTETGYTLTYEMREDDEDDFSFFDTTVAGINTATEIFFSEEGAKITDNDNDGLSEYEEVTTYGTFDWNTDSDSDGYDDKTEIDGGYNPNGEGPLSL